MALLRFLNNAAKEEEAAFRLSFLDLERPLPDALLHACDHFVAQRNDFVHPGAQSAAATAAAPEVLKKRCIQLTAAASDVLDRARDHSFPAVIKLCEIVFDEYSRKIFRGVDSDDMEVRFALTEGEGSEKLVVAAHYYMLPPKRVSVNPHIVPRSGAPPPVLFERAEAYDRASSTQRRQGDQLLGLLEMRQHERVIDVGCGAGTFTVEIASRLPEGTIHGIDISSEMVRLAAARGEAHRLNNVTFETADLLEYDVCEAFDVVLSNSTMHWIMPAERAYQQLYRILRRGGRLAVHQGGAGNYRGLRQCAVQVVKNLGLGDYFAGWAYPAYYPPVEEHRTLLQRVGFVDIEITPKETNGSEHPELVRDFAHAGLLPFLGRLPETQRDSFRAEFLEHARLHPPDLYTHRLYTVARRP